MSPAPGQLEDSYSVIFWPRRVYLRAFGSLARSGVLRNQSSRRETGTELPDPAYSVGEPLNADGGHQLLLGRKHAMPRDEQPSQPHMASPDSLTAEELRLRAARTGVPWRAWGPYLSERQWGTVREDYSENGDAWSYFSHDQARSRAYRWGEDGLAGISDDKQQLCLALALWNERDPILKERLFGLTNTEGNHGEDVKEYYFYLDNLPTHSYQRYLYKYPQAEFPYANLVAVNQARSRQELEYELIDTGVFNDGRYFDVEVEHAKNGPEDILCRITVHNRSTGDAALHGCPRCGSATRGPGGMARQSPGSPGPRPRIQLPERNTINSAFSTSMPSRKQTCCSARTRRTRRAYSAPSRLRASPRTASVNTCCTARAPSTPARKVPRWRRRSGSSCRLAGRLQCWSG